MLERFLGIINIHPSLRQNFRTRSLKQALAAGETVTAARIISRQNRHGRSSSDEK